jgi:hypothetical protein
LGRKPTDRNGRERGPGHGQPHGAWGACVVALLGLSLAYFFFAVGDSWVSIVAGVLTLAFTAFLIWIYLGQTR